MDRRGSLFGELDRFCHGWGLTLERLLGYDLISVKFLESVCLHVIILYTSIMLIFILRLLIIFFFKYNFYRSADMDKLKDFFDTFFCWFFTIIDTWIEISNFKPYFKHNTPNPLFT